MQDLNLHDILSEVHSLEEACRCNHQLTSSVLKIVQTGQECLDTERAKPLFKISKLGFFGK